MTRETILAILASIWIALLLTIACFGMVYNSGALGPAEPPVVTGTK